MIDTDGIAFVRVEYQLNNPGFPGTTVALTNAGGDTWSKTFSINTTANSGTDTVYWRFWVSDLLGNTTYLPASGGYAYTDTLDCP